MSNGREVVRLAAVGDIHCTKSSHAAMQTLFARVSEHADILVLCGDLVDYGLPDEARVLADTLSATVKVPMVGVLGNHEFESNHQDEVRQILCDAGVTMLDGEVCEILGIGFAGVKGFGGGFGQRALEPWGEATIKQFVRETVDEALKLESALARLRTPQRVAVLHYAPIRATVEGEPLEIYPFLGSSRLEEPLNCYAVTAALHGHAHGGAPEGRTRDGVPVYNVAAPLLRRAFPNHLPFRVLEIPLVPRAAAEDAPAPAR